MKDEIINNIKADLLYCYEDSYSTKEEYNKIADGRTDLEIEQEKTIQKLIEENKKLEIENNLMRELLSRPVSYTYGIR